MRPLPDDVATRLDELARLSDGWLDGKGRALRPDALHVLEMLLATADDAPLPRPGIFPTEVGGLHVEWDDAAATEVVVEPSGVATLYADNLPDAGLTGHAEFLAMALRRQLSA